MTWSRRRHPLWRTPEGRAARPELWLCATALVGVLLAEVWQNSQMANLCLRLDRSRTAIEATRTSLEYLRAGLESQTTRAKLAPLAAELGLAPADAQQFVSLPSEYLMDDGSTDRTGEPASVLALAERASSALVPSATARAHTGN